MDCSLRKLDLTCLPLAVFVWLIEIGDHTLLPIVAFAWLNEVTIWLVVIGVCNLSTLSDSTHYLFWSTWLSSVLPIGPQLIMLIIIVMSFAGGPSIEVVVSIMVDNLYLMLSMGIAFCVY